MANFRPVDRDCGFLMPPSVDEWLPEEHLVRFVVDVIESLDLREMIGSYRGSGEASYHPTILLGLLVYGYATGVFSSRKLERATYDSVALDDTKIHANASRHSALSYEHAGKIEAQLRAEVAELMARAEAADQADVAGRHVDPGRIGAPRGNGWRKLAKARATIEARAKERHARELAEHRAKLAAREAKTAATGKKPGGRPPAPPVEGPGPNDQINLTDEESRASCRWRAAGLSSATTRRRRWRRRAFW